MKTFVTRRAFVLLALLATGCQNASSPSPFPRGGPATGPQTFTPAGIVLDTLGLPVGGARVEVSDGARAGSSTETNAEGRFRFEFEVAVNETVRLRITKEGYAPVMVLAGRDVRVSMTPLLFPDLDGRYSVTFKAAPGCDMLPQDLRTRMYVTQIDRQSNRINFTAPLSGGNFYAAYDTFWGTVAADEIRFFISSWDTMQMWLEDWPVTERLASGGYVALFGTAKTVAAGNAATLSVPFDGSFAYCAKEGTPHDLFPPSCETTLAECKSTEHQLILSRQ